MTQHRSRLARPLVRTSTLVAIAAVLLLLGPQAFQARATTCGSVDSEAAFRACIVALSVDSSGPHTIVITDSFSFVDPSPGSTPSYTGSQSLTIETSGGGMTVTKHADAGVTGFLVFDPSSTSATLTIKDLSVTNFDDIGALAVLGGSLEIVNSTFYSNHNASGAGGAILAFDVVNVTLTDTSLIDNSAGWGGGIYVEASGEFVATTSTLWGNTAINEGGGVFAYQTSITTNDVDFGNNEAGAVGGAIYLESDSGTWSLTVTDGIVVGSAAQAGGGIYAEDTDVILDGVMLQNNTATLDGGAVLVDGGTIEVIGGDLMFNEATSGVGGAVAFFGTTATFTEPEFNQNSAEHGGSLYVEADELTIDSSVFVSNDASVEGGAIFVFEADTAISNTIFIANDSFVRGGAIHAETVSGGSLSITDGTIFVDSGSEFGGAIFSDGVPLKIAEAEFISNSAYGGGAVFVEQTTLEMASTYLLGNSATAVGGGVLLEDSEALIDASLFLSNSATDAGGAVAILDSQANLANTTVLDGNAEVGAGVYLDGSSSEAHLIHVTAYANTADSGSHVYRDNGTVTSFGSLYAAHTGPSGCDAAGGTVVSEGYNYSMTTDCGLNHATDTAGAAHPDTLTYGFNGGTLNNFLPDSANPLVDAIPLADCYPGVDYDQRGASRAQDGTGDGAIGCDIGSVEREGELLHFSVTTTGGVVTGTVRNLDGNPLWAITDVEAKAPGSHGQPAGIMTPYGIIAFIVELTEDGDSVEIVLNLPAPVKKLWKVDGTTWTEVASAVFDDASVTYVITDGGFGDHDGSANSRIVDPVAPGLQVLFAG